MVSGGSEGSCSHGEEQEAAEGAVVVAVVPDLSVVPQLHGQSVALLQQQGGAVGRRVTTAPGRLFVNNQLDLLAVLVEDSAHGEVGGGVGREADVVNAADRRREDAWRTEERRGGAKVSFSTVLAEGWRSGAR